MSEKNREQSSGNEKESNKVLEKVIEFIDSKSESDPKKWAQKSYTVDDPQGIGLLCATEIRFLSEPDDIDQGGAGDPSYSIEFFAGDDLVFNYRIEKDRYDNGNWTAIIGEYDQYEHTLSDEEVHHVIDMCEHLEALEQQGKMQPVEKSK